MITKVQKWGNSQGLRLSKALLSDVAIDVGDAVQVKAGSDTYKIIYKQTTPRADGRVGFDVVKE